MIERIQKVIAHSGYASRRRAEELVAAGRVTIDGRAAQIGDKVDRKHVVIEIDGIPLPVRPGLVYLLVNKPRGVVSTAADTHGRPTVVELAGVTERVYPVGRLDADSEGLILLTNDGVLTERLTHPRYGVEKTYTVLVEGDVAAANVRHLAAGVELDDGPASAVRARVVDSRPGRTLLEIVMAEGRKREVRRMCAAIGHPVHRLVRTAIGPLRDAELRPGSVRPLELDEIRILYAAAGAAPEDDAAPPSHDPQ